MPPWEKQLREPATEPKSWRRPQKNDTEKRANDPAKRAQIDNKEYNKA